MPHGDDPDYSHVEVGPLIALLDRSEPGHEQVRKFMTGFQARLITTGAVITEAFYFISELKNGPANLASFLESGAVDVPDVFTAEALQAAARLMTQYADTPMDFADATLVWIAEQTGTDKILTFDSRGFTTLRFGNNRRFKLLLNRR